MSNDLLKSLGLLKNSTDSINKSSKCTKFDHWFEINDNSYIYVKNQNDNVLSVLHLIIRSGVISEINPILNFSKILEVKLITVPKNNKSKAEFLIKKVFDFAIFNDIDRVFLTIDKTDIWLINLFLLYGFKLSEEKSFEDKVLLLNDLNMTFTDIRSSYPKIDLNSKAYILPMYKEDHDIHFPNTLYKNQCSNILEDISSNNTIEKVHVTKYDEVMNLKKGDILLIYKKSDALVPSEYGSFIYYICVVDEVRSNLSFNTFEEYLKYFGENLEYERQDLQMFYCYRKYYYTIKMTFNITLSKKITRHNLIKDLNLTDDEYWGFFEISPSKLKSILDFGGIKKYYISN